VCGVGSWTAGTAEIDREGKIIVFVGSLKSEKGQRWSPGIDPLAEMRIHWTEVGRFQSLV
jgi:predicted component of type VI protein secretion system